MSLSLANAAGAKFLCHGQRCHMHISRQSLWFQEDAHDFLRQWLDKVHDLHEKILKNGLPSKQVAAQ